MVKERREVELAQQLDEALETIAELNAELELYKKFTDAFEDWLIRDGRNQWKKKLKEDDWMSLFAEYRRRISDLETQLEERDARVEELENFVHWVEDWHRAYPLEVFPEPDLKKAHEILKQHGMTVDAISASMGRHMLKRFGEKLEALNRGLSDG